MLSRHHRSLFLDVFDEVSARNGPVRGRFIVLHGQLASGRNDLVSRKGHRIRTNKLLLSVRRLKRRVERVAPRYRTRRSKHVYTQHQLIVLLVLRQYLGTSYRELVQMLGTMTPVLREVGLRDSSSFHDAPEVGLEDRWRTAR